MHAHFEQVEWGPIYLAAGVTTVRDCGNELEFITAVRDAVAQGRGLGPSLLLAGFVDGTSTFAIGTSARRHARAGSPVGPSLSRCRISADEDLQLSQTGASESRRGRSAPPWNDRHRTRSGRLERVSSHSKLGRTRSTTSAISPTSCMRLFPTARAARTGAMPPSTSISIRRKSQKAVAFLKDHHTIVDPTIALSEFFSEQRRSRLPVSSLA